MIRESSASESVWPPAYAIAAAQTTVPVIVASPPASRPSRSLRAGASGTAEGLQERGALGLGQVGADQRRVPPVEALAQPVHLRVLRHHEQRGRALGDL